MSNFLLFGLFFHLFCIFSILPRVLIRLSENIHGGLIQMRLILLDYLQFLCYPRIERTADTACPFQTVLRVAARKLNAENLRISAFIIIGQPKDRSECIAALILAR